MIELSIDREMSFALNYSNRMLRLYPQLIREANTIINKVNMIDGSNVNNNGLLRTEVGKYRKRVDELFEIATADNEKFAQSMIFLVSKKHTNRNDLMRYAHTIAALEKRYDDLTSKTYQRLIDTVKVKEELTERDHQDVKAFEYKKILIALVREKNSVDGIRSRLSHLMYND